MPISEKLSPGTKAQHTAKWARTMTKWLIAYTQNRGSKWNLVEFGGAKAESRGIVDIMAIRKNHREAPPGLKRGDLFDIVLIQTKGGSAPRPTAGDIDRLAKVAKHYKAKSVVLGEWQKGKKLDLYELRRKKWVPVTPHEVFG